MQFIQMNVIRTDGMLWCCSKQWKLAARKQLLHGEQTCQNWAGSSVNTNNGTAYFRQGCHLLSISTGGDLNISSVSNDSFGSSKHVEMVDQKADSRPRIFCSDSTKQTMMNTCLSVRRWTCGRRSHVRPDNICQATCVGRLPLERSLPFSGALRMASAHSGCLVAGMKMH